MRLGLEQAGHKCIGFCEFDKYARQAYKAMYDTEGEWESHDVRTIRPYDVPAASLWCFGFPCQDVSVAGKQKGLQNGERSGLFFEIMRLLNGRREEDRPKWLLVENVKNLLSVGRGFDFLRLLLEMGGAGYDVEWQLLNSKEYGVPQNRERVFLVGHYRGGSGRKVFPLSPSNGANPCKLKEITQGVSDAQCIYSSDGLSRTLKGESGGQGGKTGLYAVKFRYTERGRGARAASASIRHADGIASALTSKHCNDYTSDGANGVLVADKNNTAQKQAVCAVLTPNCAEKRQNGRRMKEPGEPAFTTLTAQDRHGIAIFDDQGRKNKRLHPLSICPTLRAQSHGNEPKIWDNVRIRRLTPKECWRLQGFADEYFDKAQATGLSDTQLYRQAGNGVTVNVARAIGEKLKEVESETNAKV